MGYSAHEEPAVCAAASPSGGALVSFTASPVGGGGAEAPAVGYSEYSQWGLGVRAWVDECARASACTRVREYAATGFAFQQQQRVRFVRDWHSCAHIFAYMRLCVHACVHTAGVPAARAMSKSGLFGPVKEMSRAAPIIS